MSEPDINSLDDMIRQRKALEAAAAREPHYSIEAYMFVCEAVNYTSRRLGKRRDVRGRELLDGLCDLALERYGYMAHLVFEHWGVTRTDDFGEIVFNLVDVGLLRRTEQDSKEDFHDVFDLRQTLRERYEIDTEDLGDLDA
jgi:uncharacterized repeat protein (TIGR04138 family)